MSERKNFPKESVAKARELAKTYKKRYRSKRGRAVQLYRGDFLEIECGFDEALKQGRGGRYLHEIVKETDCFTMAGVMYLIAREAGLDPKLFYAGEMRDVGEGRDLGFRAGSDHAFITVGVEKGERHIIDPMMSLFGRIKVDERRHVAEIVRDSDKQVTNRYFAQLREVSEREYLEDVERKRGPGGGRIVLSASQAVKGAGGRRVYVSFIPQSEKVKSSVRTDYVLVGKEPYERVQIIDLETSVSSDGSFDFNDGELSISQASTAGWTTFNNLQESIKFSVSGMQKMWDIYQGIVDASGRKAPARRMHLTRFIESLWKFGFGYGWTSDVSPSSPAEEMIRERSLGNGLKDFLDEGEERINDFIERTKNDEISYRVLLRRAQMVKERDTVRSPENPWGLVFSDKEHEKLVIESHERKIERTLQAIDEIARTERIALKLKEGSDYHSRRRLNEHMGSFEDDTEHFSNIIALRGDTHPVYFKISADLQLLRQRHDVEGDINELSRGLKEADLRRSAQEKLFNYAIDSFMRRDALFLAKYRTGLKKLLVEG